MARILLMPEIAANTTQATLASWSFQPGQTFAPGQALAEIETDKAMVEIPAEEPGVMGEQLVSAGQDVQVGVPICVLLALGEASVGIGALTNGSSDASASGDGARPEETPGTVGEEEAGWGEVAQASPARMGRTFSSPVARRYARELGVNLDELSGRGPNGRIVRRDVEAAARAGTTAPVSRPSAAPAPSAEPVISPHSRLRRTIARRLTESKATIPHFYLSGDIRVDRLLELRRQVNDGRPGKISVNDFLVCAVARALVRVPDANVSWTEEGMRRHSGADVAIAVATETGLVTPIVRAAETKTVSALNAEISDLVDRARAGRLHPFEFEGGSMTVSNLGMFGVQSFSAIINPPQSAILAVGAARPAPVVSDDVLTVGMLMHCTLSVDHRAIDGALAARWFSAFVDLVERPASALA